LQPADRVEKRASWLEEEAQELREAKTIAEQADAYIDSIYFALGGLVELGVRPGEIWDLVHGANMAKVWPDGTVRRREDTKIVNMIDPDNPICPACGGAHLDRPEVDIGVGTQYGPWECFNPSCGWSENDAGPPFADDIDNPAPF